MEYIVGATLFLFCGVIVVSVAKPTKCAEKQLKEAISKLENTKKSSNARELEKEYYFNRFETIDGAKEKLDEIKEQGFTVISATIDFNEGRLLTDGELRATGDWITLYSLRVTYYPQELIDKEEK